MRNTSKKVARMLASLLVKHGVANVVMSPGSRNAPLMIAFERHTCLDTRIVIDERSAGFIGLGISVASNCSPVALVCTSGTAPLNYSPALAEAYYRQIPLIAITADRPEEWIDQDDSQTILQPGIFSNFVKGTFDIPVETDEYNRLWMINRTLNDALILAKTPPYGPVHINIRLDEPLGEIIDTSDEDTRVIRSITSHNEADESLQELLECMSPPHNIMVLCGFLPDNRLSRHLAQLAKLPNVIILHEAQSNLHEEKSFIRNIDATLLRLADDTPVPDIIITVGGSLTSRKIKNYIRELKNVIHWSIGLRPNSVDCFKHLTTRISMDEDVALSYLAKKTCYPSDKNSIFKEKWLEASSVAKSYAAQYAKNVPWSDFKAMEYIISNIPKGWNLHLSNGTSVRYAQLFDYFSAGQIHCNRGVSGIDGCTSTAIGAASVSNQPTVMISGDMSMQYDIGALATTFIPSNFKIIVINNGGGGIFRFIPSTRNLNELEKCFVADVRLPLAKLADAYSLKYLSAKDFDELCSAFKIMVEYNSSPVVLEIITDGPMSAEILTEFFEK